MSKPILHPQSVFDGTESHNINFTWDGFQIYKNKLVIKNANTNVTVYTNTQTTANTYHTIAKNSLTNGVNYSAQLSVFDASDNESVLSDSILFTCMDTPSFSFSNITNGGTIRNSSIAAEISFSQAQNDTIKEYEFLLYDTTKNTTIIDYQSYAVSGTPISYKYTGLVDDNIYYVRCKATTVAGFSVDTGFVQISVDFERPNTYSTFEAHCNHNEGTVSWTTNIIVVQDSSGKTFRFMYDGIDLSNGKLIYSSGFKLPDDFVFATKLNRPKKNAVLATLKNSSDENSKITISAEYNSTTNKYRVKLFVTDGTNGYTQYSDYYEIPNNANATVWVKRVSNTYTIAVYITNDAITPHYEYYGSTAPTNIAEGTRYINIPEMDTVQVNELNQTIYYQTEAPANPKPYDRFIKINVEIPTDIETYTTVNTPPQLNGIDYVDLGMAYYSGLVITKNISISMSAALPTSFDYDTIMLSLFNHTTTVGNVDYSVNTVSDLLIKRREKGSFRWITIYNKKITDIEDFHIQGVDYSARSNITHEYAVVPSQNGMEGNYNTTEVPVSYNGVYLSEKDVIWGTIYNTDSCDTTRTQESGIVKLMNRKKPVVIYNSECNYDSGQTSGFFAKMNEDGVSIDTESSYRYQLEFKNFLTDKKPKILKTSDGHIWLVAISSDISDAGGGHEDLRIISFPWTEIGDYDSEEDLYTLNLSDVDSSAWSNYY